MRPARSTWLPPLALRSLALGLVVLPALLAAAPARAQEEPLTAGGEGVPVPKKTRHVQPVYPAEALAQGIRGIVILDIVVDGRGKVASTSVLRSVPGLDEAAIAAARQWEYEPTKVDGRPVSVRLTVPITFSLALPRLTRQTGVPELRQGVTPAFPAGAETGGSASADVTLEPDGRVAAANLLTGEAPWSDALLAALRTWRFASPPEDTVVSFRVEADFVKGRGSEPGQVQLRAAGLRQADLLAEAPSPSTAAAAAAPAPPQPQVPAPPTEAPAAGPAPSAAGPPAAAPPPATSPAAPTPAAGSAADAPATAAPAGPAPAPAAPSPAPAAPSPAPAAAAPATDPAGAPRQGPLAAGAATPPTEATAPSTPAAPPVEVITAPPPAPPPVPPESGISAVRDVTLEPGVPELARGRRPVPPPFARMSATTGTVEVSFSVSAGGTTALQAATGPELLRYAAEQAVSSWVFRRTRADRAYLVATFTFGVDKAQAVVRPQAAPAATAEPAPAQSQQPEPAQSQHLAQPQQQQQPPPQPPPAQPQQPAQQPPPAAPPQGGSGRTRR